MMARAKSGTPKEQQSTSAPDIKVRRSFYLAPDASIRLDQEISRMREARLDAGDASELSDSDAMTLILQKYLPARRR